MTPIENSSNSDNVIVRNIVFLPCLGHRLADDFLEAGGDSLLAARLVANIRSAFDVTVPVSTVLEYPTVETLDGYLEQILGQSELLVPEGES